MSTKVIQRLLSISTLFFLGLIQLVAQDTLSTKKEARSSFLSSEVHYFATDSSIILLEEKKVLLYHEAQVHYEDIKLSAEHIILDWNKNTVFATGIADSLGNIIGSPIFKEGDKTYYCETILYNFDSKRGKIKGMKTQDGDGYIHGDDLKKQADNSMFISKSKYTTCSDDEPHFYIGANKLKIVPGNKIITGPANLVIADIPSPLFIPFGLFPIQNEQSSGLLMPSYGYSANRGYNLKNGGWYFSINDYMDLALRGDIYTLGSWKLKAQSSYKKRYAYDGHFSLSYAKNLTGEPGSVDYKDQRDFNIKWKHSQSAKAHPNRRFTANVNAGSSEYNKYNQAKSSEYLKNTMVSTISYSHSWPGKPYHLNVNLKHDQNTQTHAVNLELPKVSFGVNRFNPFERKISSGKKKWYEKISMSYTADAKNQIKTTDSLLFKEESLKDFKYGVKHSIPISSSFKILKYLNVNPNIQYYERWYFNRIEKQWIPELNEAVSDTVYGMRAQRDFTTSMSFDTKLYGMYQFKSNKIKALRHVMSPSLRFSYRPDFKEEKWGYYDWSIADSTGNSNDIYSYYSEGVYGTAPQGKSGNIGFSLNNNIELKVNSLKDSVETERKIAIFKRLNISTSYNLQVDSFNLSDIKIGGNSELLPKMNIKFNAYYKPYQIDDDGALIHRYVWKDKLSLGRLTYFDLSLDWKLNSSESNKSKERPEGTTDEQWAMVNDFQDDYVDFNIPWNIGFNYKYTMRKPGLEKTLSQTLNFNGDINLTEKWKIGFRSGYDFDNKELAYTSIDIYRDLHCWEMRFNWVPYGFHQSFNFSLNVKSSILQDLKLNKKKNYYDF